MYKERLCEVYENYSYIETFARIFALPEIKIISRAKVSSSYYRQLRPKAILKPFIYLILW